MITGEGPRLLDPDWGRAYRGYRRAPPGPPTPPSDQRPSRAAILIWLVLLGWLVAMPFLSGVATPRVFSQSTLTIAADPRDSRLLALIGRIATWGVIALSGTVIVLWAARPVWRSKGVALWLALLAVAAGPLLSSRVGTVPGTQLSLLVTPAVATALFLSPHIPLAWFLRWARLGLLVFAYASWIALAVEPAWAADWRYQGILPFLSFRLHGVAGHANSLAPMMLTYLVLDWMAPDRSRLRWLHRVVVAVTIVGAQSKTIWLLCGLMLIIWLWYRALRLRGAIRYFTLMLLAIVLALGGWGALSVESEAIVSRDDTTSLRTLTGRTQVWNVTLRVWRENPVFGYGPNLWSGAMQTRYVGVLGWRVAHAHNQILQILGEAGLIGGVTFLFYVLVLLAAAVRHGGVTGGASLALVMILLLRGITEVPIRMGTGPDGAFLLHMITFVTLVQLARGGMPNLASSSSPLPVRSWAGGRARVGQ